MLKKLEIRDFAIIDRLSMEFGGGLNVFTGETGAGKSIIIEAIGFLLGERASSELVRTGAQQAEVAGTFSSSALPKKLAAEYGLRGTEFSVRRQLDAAGRTRGFFEGRPVTAAFLSGLGDALVDFHGQNEHQSLMRPEVQRGLLDRCGRLEGEIAEYGKAFEERRKLLERLNSVSLSEEEKKRSLDLYRFQVSEIEAAALKPGEEEELQAVYPRLKNAQKLFTLSGRAYELLASGEAPAVTALEKAIRETTELAGLDGTAEPLRENLSQALILLKDASETLYGYSKNLDTDPGALDQCLSRLDKIAAMKKKYGGSVDAALAFAGELKDRITGLEDSALDKKELSARLEKAQARLRKLGEELHELRRAAAKKLSAAVLKEISGLGFKEVKFSVSVEEEEEGFTASGMDTIEFLFSANPGYPLKPLKFTASGGETSRVMLGLKSVLAASDDIPVLVFDEVDTGVGSTVGRLLGEKLSRLARAKQLFCVTHMPQVAAFADAHFRVDKSVRDGVSSIAAPRLDPEQSAVEIARMLGGKLKSSELGLKHALELIKESKRKRTGSGLDPSPFMSRKVFAWLLGGLLLLTLFSRLYRLNVPSGFYFDEVYNAYTAVGYLHGDKGAYWPWTPRTDAGAYDWTHPPLSRLLMAGGMKVCGENAVGWRLGSALAGTAAVALAAALAFELFGSPFIALFAAFFLSVDGLSFTQSRIAMNDGYFAAFALLVIWSYARWKKDRGSLKKILLTGFCLGLAAATKWTAVYLFAIIVLDLAFEDIADRAASRARMGRKEAARLALFWLALPAAMYLAAYAQFFLLGWSAGDFLTLQREMWAYHTRLSGTHACQSNPLQWVLNLRPVWLYVDRSVPGMEGNIYNTGNSVVYFAGLAAVVTAAWKFMRRPGHRLLLTAYFMLWAPWLLSPRIMFFYHYLPAVPFMCVLLGWFAENLRNRAAPDSFGLRGGKYLVWALLLSSLLWFAIFYPIHTAVLLPK